MTAVTVNSDRQGQGLVLLGHKKHLEQGKLRYYVQVLHQKCIYKVVYNVKLNVIMAKNILMSKCLCQKNRTNTFGMFHDDEAIQG